MNVTKGMSEFFYVYTTSIKVHFSGIYLVMVIFTGCSESLKGSLQNHLFSQQFKIQNC